LTDWYALAGIILGVAGIGATIFISLTVYKKQKKDGQKLQTVVDSISLLTEQKAKAEQAKKTFECQRIIGLLQRIKDDEEGLKTFLTNFKIGDPKDESWKLIFVLSFQDRVQNSVAGMNDAMGQLQGMPNDTTLRREFLNYLGWFRLIPKRILVDKMPQEGQPHLLKGLIHDIDKQMEKIQTFIDKFNKEVDFNQN
jgi:hypothetical protein